jgi:hypothetical protein
MDLIRTVVSFLGQVLDTLVSFIGQLWDTLRLNAGGFGIILIPLAILGFIAFMVSRRR